MTNFKDKFTKIFLTVCCCTIFGQALAAERIAKAIFAEPPRDAPSEVFLIPADKNGIKVELPSRNLSPDIILPPGDLVFAVLPRLLAEDEKIPASAPTVSIPKAWSRVYLVFAYDKENKVFPIKVIAVDATNSRYPLGHSRIVNISKAVVQGKFGDKIITARPGQTVEMEPPRSDFGSYRVLANYIRKGDKQSTPLMQSKWQHNPDIRQLILISKPATAKHPRMRAITDKIPPKEE